LRLAGNSPVVIIEQPPKKAELVFLIQNLNPDEIAKLPRKRLDALVELRKIGLDLRSQQGFHGVGRKLRLQLIHPPGRIM
jgi:hypothetical protein